MMNSPSLRLAYRAVPLFAWLPIMRYGESRLACTHNINKIYETSTGLQIEQIAFRLARSEKTASWALGYVGRLDLASSSNRLVPGKRDSYLTNELCRFSYSSLHLGSVKK